MAFAAPLSPAGSGPSWSGAGALLEFRGFSAAPGAMSRLLLFGRGDPAALAAWLEQALQDTPDSSAFPAACLRHAPAPWKLQAGSGEPEEVLYWYRISRGRRPGGGLRLQGWRHYGEAIGWQRRCGPMALERFLSHQRLARAGRGAAQAWGSAARA